MDDHLRHQDSPLPRLPTKTWILLGLIPAVQEPPGSCLAILVVRALRFISIKLSSDGT